MKGPHPRSCAPLSCSYTDHPEVSCPEQPFKLNPRTGPADSAPVAPAPLLAQSKLPCSSILNATVTLPAQGPAAHNAVTGLGNCRCLPLLLAQDSPCTPEGRVRTQLPSLRLGLLTCKGCRVAG